MLLHLHLPSSMAQQTTCIWRMPAESAAQLIHPGWIGLTLGLWLNRPSILNYSFFLFPYLDRYIILFSLVDMLSYKTIFDGWAIWTLIESDHYLCLACSPSYCWHITDWRHILVFKAVIILDKWLILLHGFVALNVEWSHRHQQHVSISQYIKLWKDMIGKSNL